MSTSFKNIFPKFIEGLSTKPNAVTPLSKVDIKSGRCRCANDNCFIVLANTITLDITVSGVNGLDTGIEAIDTWYAIHVINDEQGVLDQAGLLSISATSPTLPSGYDTFRRVGWVRNNASSDFVGFVQHLKANTRCYYYNAPPTSTRALQNGSEITWTNVDLSSYIPPTSHSVLLNVQFSTGVAGSASDVVVIKPTNILNSAIRMGPGVVSNSKMTLSQQIATDESQQIDYRVSDANNDATIIIKGFNDEI